MNLIYERRVISYSFRKNAIRFAASSLKREINDIHCHLRKVQILEIFRIQFQKSINSNISVSMSDIDSLVKESHVRPSLLIAGFNCLGLGVGTLCKYSPIPVQTYIIGGVNQALKDHFNDSLRDFQVDSDEDAADADADADNVKESSYSHYTKHTLSDNVASEKEYDELSQLRGEVREALKFHRDNCADENNIRASPVNIMGLSLNALFEITKKV